MAVCHYITVWPGCGGFGGSNMIGLANRTINHVPANMRAGIGDLQ
jgi:hypothetical protein